MGSCAVVFQWARAVLSPQFLSMVPNDVNFSELLKEITHDLQLTADLTSDSNSPALQGQWEDILYAQIKLIDLLTRWQNNLNCTKASELNDTAPYNSCESNEVITVEGNINDLSKNSSCNLDVIPSLNCTVPSINVKAKSSTAVNTIDQMSVAVDSASQIVLVASSSLVEHSLKNDAETDKQDGELYMNILLASRNNYDTPPTVSLEVKEETLNDDKRENPLDKLCQLLKIDEEELAVNDTTDKTSDELQRRRRYEENMPYKYFCSSCSYKTKRENQFFKHIKLHEERSVLYYCIHCQFSTLRVATLRRHELQHREGQLINCSKCPYRTDSVKLLRRHTQVQHSSKKRPLYCYVCDFKASSLRELKKHMSSHISKQKVFYNCSSCSYKTQSKGHLQRHKNDVHESKRPYLCHHCGKSFKRHDTLKQHKMIHGETGPTFTCSQCNKLCRSATQLKEHMTVHTTQRPFLCELCGATFKTRSNQAKHIKTMHTATRLVPCLLCKKTFSSKSTMTRHQKTHFTKENNVEPKTDESSKSFTLNTSQGNNLINKTIVLSQLDSTLP